MAVDNSAKQVEGHSLKIFLSYSRKDEVAADDIHRRLSSLGITVWYDKESLLPGQEWEAEIKKTIRNSDLVIVLLSTNSVSKRGFFLRELKIALDILDEIPTGHLYLIPVRLDDCKIPDRIASIHHIDLFPKWDNGFKKLLLSLQLEGEKLRHDRTDVQKTLERLEAFVRSPMSAASLDDLARLLSRPETMRDVDDALDEIGRRGFGDARIFYELEVRAIADTSSIPPGDTQDKANYQRQCALWTIGLLNRPERVRGVPTNRIMGLDAIESVLNAKSEAPDVKAAAVQSLMVINRPEDRRIVSMLRKAMNDRNPNVRRLAHEALAGRVIE